MNYGALKKMCLQYLEQSDDVKIMDESIVDLEDDDNFKEYIYNIDQSILSAFSRIVASEVLIRTHKMDNYRVKLDDAYKVKEVYSIYNGKLTNVKYLVVNKDIIIEEYNSKIDYFAIYYDNLERMMDEIIESNFDENTKLNDYIDNALLMQVKYFVYADMKKEENASLAVSNRNVFESYLEDLKRNQVEIEDSMWGGNNDSGYSIPELEIGGEYD